MLSVVILAKNEEKNIAQCLKNLHWCNEIIVIDDGSIDKTIEIAKKYGARVYKHLLENDFSRQRNFALTKTKGEWVLFIDADEIVPPLLQIEIIQKINNPKNNYSGYLIRRKDVIWRKELRHGEVGEIKLLRLAKKNTGKWEGKIHERWRIKGKVGELNNSIIHYPHQTTNEFLQEINFYTDIRASELYTQGILVYWLSIIFYPLGKFIQNYFVKLGFLDGIRGLIFSFIMSFHSFLVRAKLWLLWQKTK